MEKIISLYLLPKLISPESIIKDLELNGVKLVSNLNKYHIYSRLSNYLRLIPEDISQFLIHEDIYVNLIKVFNDFLRTLRTNELKFNIFNELISKYFHKSIIIHRGLEINYKSYLIRIRLNKYRNNLEIYCDLIKLPRDTNNKYKPRDESISFIFQRNNEDINNSLVEIKFGVYNCKKIYLPILKSRAISPIETLKYKYLV